MIKRVEHIEHFDKPFLIFDECDAYGVVVAYNLKNQRIQHQ